MRQDLQDGQDNCDPAGRWVAALRNNSEQVPVEPPGFVSQIEIPDVAFHAA